MSCYIKNEYEISPQKSYEIIRNCPKCGCKTSYINTHNFRVNANGNLVDVWLIYQCEKCKHTYNLTIYERVKPSLIAKQEYIRFLENDYNLAFEYGTKRELFSKNSAVIEEDKVTYFLLSKAEENRDFSDNDKISVVINNPYGLKVRIDKILCEILKMPRSKIKNMIKKKLIYSIQCSNLERAHLGRSLKIEVSLND